MGRRMYEGGRDALIAKRKRGQHSEMNRILRERQEEEAKPVAKPRTTHCTGCNVEYVKDGPDRYPASDVCDDCGYTACESCVCHHSRGSCYCPTSNFGRPYCIMVKATVVPHELSHRQVVQRRQTSGRPVDFGGKPGYVRKGRGIPGTAGRRSFAF
ncbi:hypothetical protein FB451DRAFT_1297496 [Mycena latifolia]|nr:hypothetical protein FB451DRAFT_1297496 [Mycena latifolia]